MNRTPVTSIAFRFLWSRAQQFIHLQFFSTVLFGQIQFVPRFRVHAFAGACSAWVVVMRIRSATGLGIDRDEHKRHTHAHVNATNTCPITRSLYCCAERNSIHIILPIAKIYWPPNSMHWYPSLADQRANKFFAVNWLNLTMPSSVIIGSSHRWRQLIYWPRVVRHFDCFRLIRGFSALMFLLLRARVAASIRTDDHQIEFLLFYFVVPNFNCVHTIGLHSSRTALKYWAIYDYLSSAYIFKLLARAHQKYSTHSMW